MRNRRAVLSGFGTVVLGSTGCLNRNPEENEESTESSEDSTGADSAESADTGAECADQDDPGIEYEQCGNKIIRLDSLPKPVQDEISGTGMTEWQSVASECEYELDEDSLLEQVMDFNNSYIVYTADEDVDYREVEVEKDVDNGVKILDFGDGSPPYDYPIRLVNETEEKLTVSVELENVTELQEATVEIASKDETELDDFEYRFGGVQFSLEVEQRDISGEESWTVWEVHRGSPTFTFEKDDYQFDEPEEVEVERCEWGSGGELVSGENS